MLEASDTDVEIVGLQMGNNDRTCINHDDVCGASLAVGELVRFKLTVAEGNTITSFQFSIFVVIPSHINNICCP